MTAGRSVTAPAPDVDRRAHAATFTVTVGAVLTLLVGVGVAGHVWHLSAIWLGPALTVVLLVLARAFGLTWAELGLARNGLRAGALWGGAVIVIVAVGYLVAVLVPATRTFFLDDRYHHGAARTLLQALVIIPIGTVLAEEIAFRSVLFGLLGLRLRRRTVIVTTSVLFGLWHILPSLDLSTANQGVHDVVGTGGWSRVATIVGAILLTAAGGLVFGLLRARADSVLASALAHWATNALGVLFGMLAWALR